MATPQEKKEYILNNLDKYIIDQKGSFVNVDEDAEYGNDFFCIGKDIFSTEDYKELENKVTEYVFKEENESKWWVFNEKIYPKIAEKIMPEKNDWEYVWDRREEIFPIYFRNKKTGKKVTQGVWELTRYSNWVDKVISPRTWEILERARGNRERSNRRLDVFINSKGQEFDECPGDWIWDGTTLRFVETLFREEKEREPNSPKQEQNKNPNSEPPTNPENNPNTPTQTPNLNDSNNNNHDNNQENPTPTPLNITPEILSKFKSLKNFETQEKIENLLKPVKDNPDFLKKLKDQGTSDLPKDGEKHQIEDLNTLLTSKTPKEIIIIIKRFEYDKSKDSKKLEAIKKIRGHYRLSDNQSLTDQQIKYLYKEAVEELEQQNNHNHKNKEWLFPVAVGGITLTILILIGFLVSRKKKRIAKRK